MPGTIEHLQARRIPFGLLSSGRWFGRVMNDLLDLLYPPTCSGCGRADTLWCKRCAEDLSAVPLLSTTRMVMDLNGCASSGLHSGPLQTAIHALKYDGAAHLAESLAERLHFTLRTQGWRPTLIIPVPIHTLRLKTRGYNQANKLAQHLAGLCGIPVQAEGLLRTRDTPSQVGLTEKERQQNVEDAFIAASDLSNHRVLLIDDVLTTGATLAACAQALRAAGALSIYGLTVSTARIDRSQDHIY